ncbi:MAG: hypothetical protein U5K36_11540 [Roseovarius sp.]|nr:hypothetical protein [Roseovarius sp.]
MSNTVRVFAITGAVVLLLVSAAAALAALRACAVDVSWLAHLGDCPTEAELARQDELHRLTMQGAALEQQISRAEHALATRQCTLVLPDPDAPLPDRALRPADLPTLYGCWSLGSSYQTRDVDTGKVISYPDWHMCFDAKGEGRQAMRGDDGSVCEGPVRARLGQDGRLILGEGGNLACDDGGYIHRRDIACTGGSARGTLTCETLQPETEGKATVPFRRASAGDGAGQPAK